MEAGEETMQNQCPAQRQRKKAAMIFGWENTSGAEGKGNERVGEHSLESWLCRIGRRAHSGVGPG